MIHRFVDEPGVRVLELDIPILARDAVPSNTNSIWQIGSGLTPHRMVETIISAVSSPPVHLADPQREPVTGATVVYCWFKVTSPFEREIRIVDWDDLSPFTTLYSETGGTAFSLEPTWKPDGSRIMFRAKGAGSALNLIKEMDPDGTNVTTLHTGTNDVQSPLYSFDGTKISWADGNVIKTADSDGTNVVSVFTASGSDVVSAPAWRRGSLALGFRTAGNTFTSNEVWRVVNADGTGSATWLTISRASGYGPSEGDPAALMWSWATTDKIATTVRQVADPFPDARLTLIDSGGSNLVSPARYAPSETGSSDTRPAVLTGMSEGVERIYYYDQTADVCSVLLDGSDFRTDFDSSALNSSFHGFRGDTANV